MFFVDLKSTANRMFNAKLDTLGKRLYASWQEQAKDKRHRQIHSTDSKKISTIFEKYDIKK